MGSIDVRSPAMLELVDERAEVRRLATGFGFTEGPVWHPREQVLYFSDLVHDARRTVALDGTVRIDRQPAFRGNGLAFDSELRLVVCEHVSSSLVRVRADGVRETLAYHWQGTYLNSPNDLVIRSDGTIYFSDPWYGRMGSHGLERPRELGWQGVFRLPPGGGADDLDLAVPERELHMPNGVCLSPDESLLYVDDTPRAHVKVFDVRRDGTLANGRVFFEGIGSGAIDEGVVDGLECDEHGNVWVTGPGGIWVISPEGEHLGVVEVAEPASNLAWGGPDWHTLFVTARTSVYAVETVVGPRREPHMAAG